MQPLPEIEQAEFQATIPSSWGRIPAKPVNARKRRPAWAQTTAGTFLRALGPKALRRWEVADLYWLRNLRAREVAERLSMTVKAVTRILERLKSPRMGDRIA